jgi:hypothetical protein
MQSSYIADTGEIAAFYIGFLSLVSLRHPFFLLKISDLPQADHYQKNGK